MKPNIFAIAILSMFATVAIAVLSAPLSNAVAAEPPQWLLDELKVDNPNELVVYLAVAETCHYTTEDAEKLVSGALIRSRIKPLINGARRASEDLYLDISIECIENESELQTMSWTVYFAHFRKMLPTYNQGNYGGFGRQDKSDIANYLRSSVENAIADFIKANLDL